MTLLPAKAAAPPNRLANQIGLLSGAALLTAILMQSSIFVINYDEVGLRARFGTLSGILDPGPHWKIPFGVDYIETVSASKIIVQESGYRSPGVETVPEAKLNAERTMITADLDIVEIAMAIHYQVKDPVAYLSSVRDPDRFVRSASEAIVREIVGRSQSGALFTTSGQTIADDAKPRLQSYLDSFHLGIDVKTVEIREIAPPAGVRPAFDKVNEARQERERRVSEAERAADRKIAEATGRATAIAAEAKAEAIRRETEAHGESAQFAAFEEAYREAPFIVKTALYTSTMAKVLPRVKSIVVTQDNSLPAMPLLNVSLEKKD